MSEKLSAELQLKAWKEWRKWCSIWRVKKPLPTEDELSHGLSDDIAEKDRKIYFNYLQDRIRSTIYVMLPEDSQKEINIDELISEFDNFMKSPKAKTMDGFKSYGSTYKDFIFFRMEGSTDAPMKVLNGKIFSSKGGYFLDILKQYRKTHFTTYIGEKENEEQWGAEEDSRGKRLTVVDAVSLDKPLEGSDHEDGQRTLGDTIGGGNVSSVFMHQDDVNYLYGMLTDTEKILLLAKMWKISFSEPCVIEATGLSKSCSYDAFSSLTGKLKENFPDISAGVIHSAQKKIIHSLLPEKNAKSFLKEVGKRMKQEGIEL